MDEKKKVIEDVDKDRRYAIDASIVRIMKSRKVLGHQQLVMECVEQLGRMFRVSRRGDRGFAFPTTVSSLWLGKRILRKTCHHKG